MDSINQIEEIRRAIQKRRGITESPADLEKIASKLKVALQKNALDPVKEHLDRAQEKNTFPKWVPKFLHPLRRNQAAVNAELMTALAELYKAVGALAGNNPDAGRQNLLEQGLGFLNTAMEKSATSPRLPTFIRPMRRNQGAVNEALAGAIGNLCALLDAIARWHSQMGQGAGDSTRLCLPANEQIAGFLERARSKNKVHGWMPAFLHFMRRNQGAINVAFINSANELYRTTRMICSEGSLTPTEYSPSLYHQSVHVADHELQRAEEKNRMPRWLPKFLHAIRRNQGTINFSLITSVRGFEHAIIQIYQRLADLRKNADDRQADISALAGAVDQLDRKIKAPESLAHEIASLRGEMSRLQESNKIFQEHFEKIPPPKISQKEIDNFYLAFENRHRGDRGLIKQRIRVYLPVIAEAKENTGGRKVVDIGCGRGEWLELLRENQLDARGVDMNERMVAECLSLGLDAEQGDGIAFLRSMEAASVSVVSGFHIAEHLPLVELLELFRETWRVLKPGGVAIFETPNPEVLRVSSYTFYLDPTHRNPIPPELMTFFGDHAGFSKSRIERYQPYSEEGVFKGYGDYAGIFTK